MKIILDGALLSENVLLSTNRNGMIRIAEEVLQELVLHNDADLSFMNTIYSKKYHFALLTYLGQHYPDLKNRIVSKTPLFSSTVTGFNRLTREISQLLELQVKSKGIVKGDLFHSFYYPFNKAIASDTALKKSITFLDIIPLRLKGYSQTLIETTKRVVQSIIPNYAISISEFSKQDLLDFDKRVSADRVFVAPLAASKELFFQNKSREEWIRVKKKYGLPDKYFLSVSSTDIRKNLLHLIYCFNEYMLQEKPKDLFLVLTGNTMYSQDYLDSLGIDKAVREKIIITKSFIDNQDLSVIYSNALCFFFMSLYEGFGLPVLEAMQCGVPVVTSNVSSMPEVAGNAAALIDPRDKNVLSNLMAEMYSNESMRSTYSSLGLIRANDFSWQKCANQYYDIFKNITSNN